MNIFDKLADRKIIKPEKFLKGNIQYLVMMGSVAYGCNEDNSDLDLYGFAIPPKAYVFPHTAGEIPGFSKPKHIFNQFLADHIKADGKEYDFAIYSIVKFFRLAMECSPNIIDTLFVPERCILQTSTVGKMVRQYRELFLSKKLYHTMVGYAHSQLHKMDLKTPQPGSKRAALIEKYGVDTKYLYNLVRTVLECQQAMLTGDIELDRDRELYKAIRRGEWSLEKGHKFLEEMAEELRLVYNSNNTLPMYPDEEKITQLLLNCLEEYYGSLSNCIVIPDALDKMSDELLEVIKRYTGK